MTREELEKAAREHGDHPFNRYSCFLAGANFVNGEKDKEIARLKNIIENETRIRQYYVNKSVELITL